MLSRVSWQQVTRNGIPPLAAIRRPLQFGDRTFAVGEVLTGLPDQRLRQFYEQRRAGLVAALPLTAENPPFRYPVDPWRQEEKGLTDGSIQIQTTARRALIR